MNAQPAPMLKFRPVADALGVSETTARRLARAGVLERVQVSERGYRVTEESLRRLLSQGYAAARDGAGSAGRLLREGPGPMPMEGGNTA